MTSPLLLLGATGFAGRHLADAAREAGIEVVTASRRGGEADVVCDVLEPESLERALGDTKPAAVANLTGAASVSRSWSDPAAAFRVNALGTLNLLDAVAAKSPEALILAVSSGEVYGNVPEEQQPVKERHPLRPLNPYGTSKAAMEVVCGQYADTAGLRIVVVRAFNHLGPGQSDTFVSSSFARQVAEAELAGAGEAVLRVGNLSARRDFTDVRDMVRAYVAAIERELTGTYNACSERAVEVGNLIDLLGKASELPIRVEVEESRVRSVEVPVLYGSAERLRGETGWRPEIPLDRTVADLLAWWREKLGVR